METETRYQRVARQQRERQAARAQREEANRQRAKRKIRFRPKSDRVADRIDGYDRDNLGESPDF